MSCFARPSLCRGAVLAQTRRWMSTCRVFADGSIRVENCGEYTASSGTKPATNNYNNSNHIPPAATLGPGEVGVKLLVAPCTPSDLRTLDAAAASADATVAANTNTMGTASTSTGQHNPSPSPSPLPPPPLPSHLSFKFPFVGGSEGLWEVTAAGEGVSWLRPGDLAIPTITGSPPGCLAGPESGTWRKTAVLGDASLVKVPPGEGQGANAAVVAHCAGSVATALRVLEDFAPVGSGGGEGRGERGGVKAGDRVVFTGASSAVAQILIQLAASRGLESVCLVNSEEEAALAMRLGAWKATLLKEFKAMRMDNAHLVADGEGGVLGFTAARALRFRGSFVSYADASGDGVSLPVAAQIFRDTRCRGFSLARWAAAQPAQETRALTLRALETALAVGLKLEGVREFDLSGALAGIGAARTPGGPVLFRA